MDAPESLTSLFLFGGPLHGIGRRLGLVRGTNSVRLGFVLGVGLWLLVVALAVLGGVTDRLFQLSVVGGHARLLLVIPLFFVCESSVGPRMTAFVLTIARTGVVPPGVTVALGADVTRANRRANAWQAEAACLLIAILLDVTGTRLLKYGASDMYDPTRLSLAAFVYFRVGVTLFRFLLFRWAWKIVLWSWFLWRVSRLDLHLMPGHPDRAGGLGPLEGVQEKFGPLIAGLSIVQCASLAESISTGTLVVSVLNSSLAACLTMALVVDGVLFLGPMLVFTDKLSSGRAKGMRQYMNLAARYVTKFEAKWTAGDTPEGVQLLGTADLQSMADLDGTVTVVKEMRWITVGRRLLTMIALTALVPFAPLLLFEYPVAELAEKFFSKLIGL